MSGYVLQARIDQSKASVLRSRFIENPSAAMFSEVAFREHLNGPRAFPSTGGRRVEEHELLSLRHSCLQVVSMASDIRPPERGAFFDLEIGKTLYEFSSGSRGEFGTAAVWDFLALVLLPDVVTTRLGEGASPTALGARLTGGNRRHVIQRLWRRWAVFGQDLVEQRVLSEDDYVALLERRLTSERPELARAVAASIRASGLSSGDRREYTRLFMRHLLQASGAVAVVDDESDKTTMLIEHTDKLTLAAMNKADVATTRRSSPSESSSEAEGAGLELEEAERRQTSRPTARRRRPFSIGSLLRGG